ncbi:MAG: ribosome silencing factor [Elusimicrobiota bacterium]
MPRINRLSMARSLCGLLAAKHASRINLFRFTAANSLADYFAIASANSSTHLKALEEYLTKALKESGLKRSKPNEGRGSDEWRVVDAGYIIIHLMQEKARNRYHLETLWANSKKLPWKDAKTTSSVSSKKR